MKPNSLLLALLLPRVELEASILASCAAHNTPGGPRWARRAEYSASKPPPSPPALSFGVAGCAAGLQAAAVAAVAVAERARGQWRRHGIWCTVETPTGTSSPRPLYFMIYLQIIACAMLA